jgi:hypothetical protein
MKTAWNGISVGIVHAGGACTRPRMKTAWNGISVGIRWNVGFSGSGKVYLSSNEDTELNEGMVVWLLLRLMSLPRQSISFLTPM